MEKLDNIPQADIVAIDIGFRHTGVSLFKKGNMLDCFYIKTEPNTAKKGIRKADLDVDSCQIVFRALSAIISACQPKLAVVELPSSGGKSALAIASMARAQAIVGCLVESFNLPAEWVTPTDVKKATAGKRNASKEEVARGVQKRFANDAVFTKILGKYKNVSQLEHIYDSVGAYMASENSHLTRLLNNAAD